jgi:N-terminal domain of unknown function (DUF4140)
MRFRAASITSERSEKIFQAADDAPITQVTVCQTCAEVTRTLTVACAETGSCDIKLQGVPSIDPNSLHAKAQGKCALQRVSYNEVPDQTEPGALPGQIVVSDCHANARVGHLGSLSACVAQHAAQNKQGAFSMNSLWQHR